MSLESIRTINQAYYSGDALLTEEGKSFRKGMLKVSVGGGIGGGLLAAAGITILALTIVAALHTSLPLDKFALKGLVGGIYWGSVLTISGTVLSTRAFARLGKLNRELTGEERKKYLNESIQ